MDCCLISPPRPCARSPPIRSTWARASALTLVLHTWGSALTHHPHVHGIVPGGGLALDADRWVPCKPGFFLPVRVLSRLFRRRFLEELARRAHGRGQLKFFGELARSGRRRRPSPTGSRRCASASGWSTPSARSQDLKRCSPICRATPTGSPSPTHDSWLWMNAASPSAGRTTATKGRTRHKTMTLAAEEFMRRFLLHVLPAGFHRIRHYGLLANANRKQEHRAPHARCCSRQRQRLPLDPATPRQSAQPLGPPSCAGTAARRCSSSRPSPALSTSVDHQVHRPTMIDIASINRTSPAAFSSIDAAANARGLVLQNVPFCRTTISLVNSPCRCVLGSPPTHIDHAAATIFVSSALPIVQIPIVPRRC